MFSNVHAWPGAFIADKLKIAPTPADVLDVLSALPARQRDARDRAEHVVVRTDTEESAVLVLLDTDAPRADRRRRRRGPDPAHEQLLACAITAGAALRLRDRV